MARRVRKSGLVPATLYGASKQPVSISLNPKQVKQILRSAAGHNTIFELQMDGENAMGMIVDWQNEPIKGSLACMWSVSSGVMLLFWPCDQPLK